LFNLEVLAAFVRTSIGLKKGKRLKNKKEKESHTKNFGNSFK